MLGFTELFELERIDARLDCEDQDEAARLTILQDDWRRERNELVESIESVTADDVQRIARRFFDPRQIAVTVLGNLNGFKLGREDLAC